MVLRHAVAFLVPHPSTSMRPTPIPDLIDRHIASSMRSQARVLLLLRKISANITEISGAELARHGFQLLDFGWY